MNRNLMDMTRRERRGMIVVLVAVALMLLVAVWARHYRGPDADAYGTPPTTVADAASDSDSVAVQSVESRPARKAPSHSRKRSSRPSRQPKPVQPPRPLDPVPQFGL